MRLKTIKKLCCPFDKGDLELTIIRMEGEIKVMEGLLYCPDCKRAYPIIKGVPVMSPDEYREFRLEKPLFDRWQSHLSGKKFEQFRLGLSS